MLEYFIKISCTGDIEIVEYTSEVELCRFLRDQIGCSSIESVCSSSGFNHRLIVDECFLMKTLQPELNPVASYLYSEFRYAICGTALLGAQGYRDGEPDIVGFDRVEALRLVSRLKHLRSRIFRLEVIR